MKGLLVKNAICLILLLAVWGCASQEMMRVRKMDIHKVDISRLADGDYIGSFSYGGYEYRVRTAVKAHRIVDIAILQNRDTRHAKKAEGVISRIMERQTPDVDAISGATTTSKALMKAVENALNGGPS